MACHRNSERQGYIRTRVRGNLTAKIWNDIRHVNMLTNMHHPPAEGNFHDEHGNALKPMIIQGYDQQTGYVNKVTAWQTHTPSADGHSHG
jgi:hypothetical protein